MSNTMIMLKISKEINNSLAVSSDDGNKIFRIIVPMLRNGETLELDFEGIDIMTSAFLNAAIGQLYSEFKSEQLNSLLKLVNVADEDRSLIKKVIERAKEYFANKDDFGTSADNAIYGR